MFSSSTRPVLNDLFWAPRGWEKCFSPIYISSLHKEPAVWRWNMNWYIYLPKEVELHKDVLCVSDCHDCYWIWKGLSPQIMHPLTFYNYIVDRRGLHIFIWLTIMWKFLVIKAARNTLKCRIAFCCDCFCFQKSELCWSRWQESNEGVWGSYWLSGVLRPRSHSWLQDRWQGEMKMISIPEKMFIFIVRFAKQTAQRFDLSCNYGSTCGNFQNCGVVLLYICVGAYLYIYKY